MINCYNRGNVQDGSVCGGLIGFDDINGTTNVVNCYNAGDIYGKGQVAYSALGNFFGQAYNKGTRNIINSCGFRTYI